MPPPAVHPFLLGLRYDPDPATRLPPAPQSGEWEEIIRAATGHRLAPLLYQWLKRSGLDQDCPARLVGQLRRELFKTAARNMLLAGELGIILRAFNERRLPCAPLRGLALAERLYGNSSPRPMGDLDLLVRKRDLPEVAGILRGLGFREMDRRPGFAPAFSYTLTFFTDRQGWIIVEPHWTIAYPPFVDSVDMDLVWARCARGRVAGVETWLLGREELLLHLCLHIMHRDETAPLLWLYELDRLLRTERDSFDWTRFLALARGAKLEFLIVPVLEKARRLFATPLPDRVLEQLALEPPRAGRLGRLLAGDTRVDGKESLALFFALEGLGPKLRYAFALLFPTPEFMRLQYGLTGKCQLGFAYLRRLCRFAWESLKGIARLLF